MLSLFLTLDRRCASDGDCSDWNLPPGVLRTDGNLFQIRFHQVLKIKVEFFNWKHCKKLGFGAPVDFEDAVDYFPFAHFLYSVTNR